MGLRGPPKKPGRTTSKTPVKRTGVSGTRARAPRIRTIRFSKTGFYFDAVEGVYKNRRTGRKLSFEFDARRQDTLNLKEGKSLVTDCGPRIVTIIGGKMVRFNISSIKEVRGMDVRPANIRSYVGKGSGAGVLPVLLHYFKSLGARRILVYPYKNNLELARYYRRLGFRKLKGVLTAKGEGFYLDLSRVQFE